jgi:hypothetical protein
VISRCPAATQLGALPISDQVVSWLRHSPGLKNIYLTAPYQRLVSFSSALPIHVHNGRQPHGGLWKVLRRAGKRTLIIGKAKQYTAQCFSALQPFLPQYYYQLFYFNIPYRSPPHFKPIGDYHDVVTFPTLFKNLLPVHPFVGH